MPSMSAVKNYSTMNIFKMLFGLNQKEPIKEVLFFGKKEDPDLIYSEHPKKNRVTASSFNTDYRNTYEPSIYTPPTYDPTPTFDYSSSNSDSGYSSNDTSSSSSDWGGFGGGDSGGGGSSSDY